MEENYYDFPMSYSVEGDMELTRKGNGALAILFHSIKRLRIFSDRHIDELSNEFQKIMKSHEKDIFVEYVPKSDRTAEEDFPIWIIRIGEQKDIFFSNAREQNLIKHELKKKGLTLIPYYDSTGIVAFATDDFEMMVSLSRFLRFAKKVSLDENRPSVIIG